MSSKLPAVSILMPVYNAEVYLAKAVGSILGQTFGEFELLVMDDGSSDESVAIMERFAVSDERIWFKASDKQGLTKLLNAMLCEARGRYIARMDADDVAMPDRFKAQVDHLDRNPDVVAVGTRVLLVDPDGDPIRLMAEETSHEEIDDAHLAGAGGSRIVHPSVMLRSSALRAVDGYREGMEPAEDLDLFLRMAEIGRLANLPETLLHYRLHPKSVGHERRREQRAATLRAVNSARERRGMELLPVAQSAGDALDTAARHHLRWAWWALGAGNVRTARKHAWRAWRRAPWERANWRALACAIRGH